MFPSLHSAVQWLLAIVGAGLSGTVIVLTLLPILRANAAKGRYHQSMDSASKNLPQ